MSNLVLAPDAEALVSAFLRAQPEVTAIFDDRVYTVLPNAPTWPACRVNLFDEVKVTDRTLWLFRFSLQIDCWGGSKSDAFRGCATVQAAIDARLDGIYPQGVVTDVSWGAMTDFPDPSYSPARPRYLTRLYLTAHP